MIGDRQPITLKVMADAGKIGSAQAVSMGLIVTELVTRASFASNMPQAA